VEYLNADDVIGFYLGLMNEMLWILSNLRRNTNKRLSYTIGTIETIDQPKLALLYSKRNPLQWNALPV